MNRYRIGVIQGGSGNQLLVGLGHSGQSGNRRETIIGGNMGIATAAWTTIDGGGRFVDVLRMGGGQNGFIVGGPGSNTIVAASNPAASGKPDLTTAAPVGLSFRARSSLRLGSAQPAAAARLCAA